MGIWVNHQGYYVVNLALIHFMDANEQSFLFMLWMSLQIISRDERVAFIGISNWALDPAKMNRGVMVTRGDPSDEELVFSAKGICSNKENDPVRMNLQSYFGTFAHAYKEICKKQEREFFGLRDFYRLEFTINL